MVKNPINITTVLVYVHSCQYRFKQETSPGFTVKFTGVFNIIIIIPLSKFDKSVSLHGNVENKT